MSELGGTQPLSELGCVNSIRHMIALFQLFYVIFRSWVTLLHGNIAWDLFPPP